MCHFLDDELEAKEEQVTVVFWRRRLHHVPIKDSFCRRFSAITIYFNTVNDFHSNSW